MIKHYTAYLILLNALWTPYLQDQSVEIVLSEQTAGKHDWKELKSGVNN